MVYFLWSWLWDIFRVLERSEILFPTVHWCPFSFADPFCVIQLQLRLSGKLAKWWTSGHKGGRPRPKSWLKAKTGGTSKARTAHSSIGFVLMPRLKTRMRLLARWEVSWQAAIMRLDMQNCIEIWIQFKGPLADEEGPSDRLAFQLFLHFLTAWLCDACQFEGNQKLRRSRPNYATFSFGSRAYSCRSCICISGCIRIRIWIPIGSQWGICPHREPWRKMSRLIAADSYKVPGNCGKYQAPSSPHRKKYIW